MLKLLSFLGSPKVVNFKGVDYKVIDYLGMGLEGLVVRVQDSAGQRSIMKIFLNPRRGHLRQMWDYYQMNKGIKNPYTVIGIDHKNKIFQFADMRGLPMNHIDSQLLALGASEEAVSHIYKMVAMIGFRHYEQNVVYDIDRNIFVSIDPH